MKKMLIIAEVYTIHSMNYICFLYILTREHEIKIWWKHLQDGCASTNMQLSASQDDGLESCRLLVDYCDVYQLFGISFWRHPFTAEDPLVSKWCTATFLPKQLIYILDGRVSTF